MAWRWCRINLWIAADGGFELLHRTPAVARPGAAQWRHWLNEIKHDGFRLIVWRESGWVRLFTRNGHDWAARYPAILAEAATLPARSFPLSPIERGLN